MPAPAPRTAPASRRGARVGSVLGFEIRIDTSWLVIFFLVFWSLARGVFPDELPELATSTHTAMGLAGTLLFFVSLLIHELSHAVVSRSKGIPVEGITLFIFGGIAHTSREPDTPKDELLIAGIGPVTSLALAALFWMIARVIPPDGLGVPAAGVAQYLAVINLALAVFNLLPGFPLDGGRVFRAIAWSVTGSRTKATRLASAGGRGLGLVLIVLGAVQALGGAPVGGLWLVFIGWFLRSLAGMSMRQHVLHEVLKDFTAADLMSRDPEVVPTDLPLEALVRERFMRLRYGSYPVVDRAGELVGVVTLDNVKSIPRDVWRVSEAGDAMTPLSDCVVVGAGTPAVAVLEEMSRRGGRRRALVVDHGRLVGVISATDIAHWIERAQGLEELIEVSSSGR
jgi:Zn-dependent protease